MPESQDETILERSNDLSFTNREKAGEGRVDTNQTQLEFQDEQE